MDCDPAGECIGEFHPLLTGFVIRQQANQDRLRLRAEIGSPSPACQGLFSVADLAVRVAKVEAELSDAPQAHPRVLQEAQRLRIAASLQKRSASLPRQKTVLREPCGGLRIDGQRARSALRSPS